MSTIQGIPYTEAQFDKHGIDGLHLLPCRGRGNIHHVQKQVRVNGLFESRPKRGHQSVRQVANEPHGVVDDDLALAREPQAVAAVAVGDGAVEQVGAGAVIQLHRDVGQPVLAGFHEDVPVGARLK